MMDEVKDELPVLASPNKRPRRAGAYFMPLPNEKDMRMRLFSPDGELQAGSVAIWRPPIRM
jgi:hypothetical protein